MATNFNKQLLLRPHYAKTKGILGTGLKSFTVDSDHPTGVKPAWTQTNEPKTAREKAQFKNKIPFDESMYEVLKTAIELLSRRINGPDPLSSDEAAWLLTAVEIIIADAHTYGPPPKPPKTTSEETQ